MIRIPKTYQNQLYYHAKCLAKITTMLSTDWLELNYHTYSIWFSDLRIVVKIKIRIEINDLPDRLLQYQRYERVC